MHKGSKDRLNKLFDDIVLADSEHRELWEHYFSLPEGELKERVKAFRDFLTALVKHCLNFYELMGDYPDKISRWFIFYRGRCDLLKSDLSSHFIFLNELPDSNSHPMVGISDLKKWLDTVLQNWQSKDCRTSKIEKTLKSIKPDQKTSGVNTNTVTEDRSFPNSFSWDEAFVNHQVKKFFKSHKSEYLARTKEFLDGVCTLRAFYDELGPTRISKWINERLNVPPDHPNPCGRQNINPSANYEKCVKSFLRDPQNHEVATYRYNSDSPDVDAFFRSLFEEEGSPE